MKKSDFYNFRSKERKINFLADYRIVRRYFVRKFNLTAAKWDMLLKLHSLGTFIKKDFDNYKLLLPWEYNRWSEMQVDGWIIVSRERRPSLGQNYKVYSLSPKGKTAVEDCYKMLCGEIPIPVKNNPVMTSEAYSDVRHANAIRAFNSARNKNS